MEVSGVKIEWLGHSGFLITTKEGKKIAIDPYNISESVAQKEKADLILITHSHYDHCSIKDITKLAKKGTVIAISADSQSKITRIDEVEMHIVEVGEEFSFEESIKVSAVPAYNVDKDFHPKSEGWMGFVIKTNNVVIYHAGDSDKIPEMQKLSGYGKQGVDFIAILPVSGKFVMTPDEAASAASLLNPTVAIPMHYGAGIAGTKEDAELFVKLCSERGVKAQILDKI